MRGFLEQQSSGGQKFIYRLYNKVINMDLNNENQGFQHPIDSFDFIEMEQMAKPSEKRKCQKKQKKLPQPPISTYLQTKNCPTPSCLNQVYSQEKEQKKEKEERKDRYKGIAWCVAEQKLLAEQFNKEKYRTVYNKFKEDRSNYKFYRQYARHEYKSFIDQDTLSQEQSQEEEIRQGSQSNKKYMLDFLKIEKIISSKSKELIFRSNFQAGNLEKVYTNRQLTKNDSLALSNDAQLRKTTSTRQPSLSNSTNNENNQQITPQKQYYLILSNDTNTIGFNQWFYFKVYNPNFKEITANFIIVNLNKKTIPYIEEIGINYFSVNDYKYRNVGWNKLYQGIAINNKNNLKKDNENYYHTLQFQARIKPEDTSYFSLAIPYTFTKLLELVQNYRESFDILGITFCGNPIYVYKTGNPDADKSILITARQHPSQTSASYVVEGIIKRISKMSPLLSILKKKYQIYVIPMANPDGVIHGNSRTNLLGYDINRKWETVPNKKDSHEVFSIIYGLIKKIPKIQYLIDLHGHSKKLNSFAYFSTKKSIAALISLEMAEKLPWFKTSDCQMTTFAPSNTLRWYSATELEIEKAITLQTSIHGWCDENNNILPFTPEKMSMIGATLIDAICRVQMQKRSTIKSIKNFEFSQNYQSSDSDPERDYIKKQQCQNISPPSRLRSQSYNQQQMKKISSPVQKLRLKTSSTFYKQIINSAIRERTKTEYTVQKLNIQMENPPEKSISTVLSRKKTSQIRYYRIKQNKKINNMRMSQKYNDLSNLLNRNGGKSKGDSFCILGQAGKSIKAKKNEQNKLKIQDQSFETTSKSIQIPNSTQQEHKQKLGSLKAKLKSNLMNFSSKKD